ncbi:sensor histidine kinase [Spirosoma fluviale]|uniref:Histidine kinase n=1 Tax=Spirosoma fluviale TaxID=1597977 RepID=A0A286FYH9_9BACT|nr:histidine kinase [Spirosoma fluviale]SOD88076.1 Histidine kinase [Spirosoma fluviale]
METTLEKVPHQTMPFAPQQRISPRLIRFWETWGIWLVIVACTLVLFLFTDFGDFMQGFKDGYTESGRKEPTSFIVALVGVAFALILSVGVLWGLSHAYYSLFHRHVFKNNKLAYTVLYIICLLLIWNVSTDGLAKVFDTYNLEQKKNAGAYNEMFASALTSLLLICMVIYGFIVDFRKSRKLQLTLIQQRTQAELDALKAQVNPHFLFNSLNNIYGTAILEDSPRTAESIQQLSGIVRYVMEESRLQTTDIQRELRFIDDFVELQRIRLPNQDNIDIKVTIDWDEKPARIVPLLLNPLIENAFKYGISMQFPCFVHIRLRVQDGTLHLTTENSVLGRTDMEKGTGLGLTNVRQRLTLAYPDRHTLTVSEEGGAFLIDLEIRL